MTTTSLGLDIDAVAAACQLDSFALLTMTTQGPFCIEYAATHPGAVTALILCDTVATIEGSFMGHIVRTAMGIHRVAEELGGQRIQMSFYDRVVPPDEREAWALLLNAAGEYDDPDDASGKSVLLWDAEPFLRDVAAPTLVLNSRSDWKPHSEASRYLASAIAEAELKVIDGPILPYVGDRPALLTAIDTFLQKARA